jgi:hypothetical protein
MSSSSDTYGDRCGALAFGYFDWEKKAREEGDVVRPKSHDF